MRVWGESRTPPRHHFSDLTMTTKEHYLRLYKSADEILKQPDNPCEIKKEDNGGISCARTRKFGDTPPIGRTWCCGGCKHLGPDGCTVESLSCKLAWCYIGNPSISMFQVEDHPTFGKIKELALEAEDLKIPLFARESFQQTFRGD